MERVEWWEILTGNVLGFRHRRATLTHGVVFPYHGSEQEGRPGGVTLWRLDSHWDTDCTSEGSGRFAVEGWADRKPTLGPHDEPTREAAALALDARLEERAARLREELAATLAARNALARDPLGRCRSCTKEVRDGPV